MDKSSVKIEYYFYTDKRGKQRFYYKSERNLHSKITLKNKLAVIIDTIQLIWSLKMTTPNPALLPCPFCGGIKISRMKLDKEPLVSCENKGCPIYDRQIRIDEWNTRTAAQPHGYDDSHTTNATSGTNTRPRTIYDMCEKCGYSYKRGDQCSSCAAYKECDCQKRTPITDAQRQAAHDDVSAWMATGSIRAGDILSKHAEVIQAALRAPAAVPQEVVEEFVSMYCNVKIRGYGTRAESMSRQEWKEQYEQFEKEALALLGGKEG